MFSLSVIEGLVNSSSGLENSLFSKFGWLDIFANGLLAVSCSLFIVLMFFRHTTRSPLERSKLGMGFTSAIAVFALASFLQTILPSYLAVSIGTVIAKTIAALFAAGAAFAPARIFSFFTMNKSLHQLDGTQPAKELSVVSHGEAGSVAPIQKPAVSWNDFARDLPLMVKYFDSRRRLLFAHPSPGKESIGLTPVRNREDLAFEPFTPHLESCLAGQRISVELANITGSDSVDWVDFIPQYDARQNVHGALVVATPVTRYRQAEQNLSAAKLAAETASATKSAFLANMSHEIRTPLGAVLGFSDLLAQPFISPQEKEKYVDAIKRNGTLLKSLIDDILDISKVEAGKLSLEIQSIALDEILSDIMSHLGVQAAQKNIEIVFRKSADMPKLIDTDPTRLKQMLINIVGNAVKFTERGRVEVLMERLPGGNQIAFHVKDSGCGISRLHAKDLFKPFGQGDASTQRHYGGTGLGLVLSRQFARLLGGDVVLTHSVPGEGSIFTITVDAAMARNRHDESPLPLDKEDVLSNPYALQGVSVLLVEDAPDTQLLITTYLASAGAHYEIANNGLEALSKAKQGNFDVVIMDIQMPIMDGYETADELRLRGYTKPLIALTAHTMIEEKEKCLAHGFEVHIGKPIHPQVLLATIKHLVAPDKEPRCSNHAYEEGNRPVILLAK